MKSHQMSDADFLELEQEILEVTSQEPILLFDIYDRGFKVHFVDFCLAIGSLVEKGQLEQYEVEGKPAYIRTFKGYERQAMYYE